MPDNYFHFRETILLLTKQGVVILTFIIMTNTSPSSLKAREVFIFQHFSPYEQLKPHDQLSRARTEVKKQR